MVSTVGMPTSRKGTWSLLNGWRLVWTTREVWAPATAARASMTSCDTAAPSRRTVGVSVLRPAIMSMLTTARMRSRSADDSPAT
jgi:hypothetical protein